MLRMKVIHGMILALALPCAFLAQKTTAQEPAKPAEGKQEEKKDEKKKGLPLKPDRGSGVSRDS